MKKLSLILAVALALGCVAIAAHATDDTKPVLVSEVDGGTITLFEGTKGVCVREGQYFELKLSGVMVPGCWQQLNGTVYLAYWDGDFGQRSVIEFRRFVGSEPTKPKKGPASASDA